MHYIAWSLTGVVSILAVYVWGTSFNWDIHAINAYQFFPVLGLLGFSIMWSHYIIGTVLRLVRSDLRLQNYFDYTGYAVLLAIVLHPSILIYQRFRDGFGLPPKSYETFVAAGMAWITLLGTASLLIFLTFELCRFYSDKSWWKYVVNAGDAAMLAIFYHGLRLGSQLQGGWYQGVWIFYGIALFAVIAHKYYDMIIQHRSAPLVK